MFSFIPFSASSSYANPVFLCLPFFPSLPMASSHSLLCRLIPVFHSRTLALALLTKSQKCILGLHPVSCVALFVPHPARGTRLSLCRISSAASLFDIDNTNQTNKATSPTVPTCPVTIAPPSQDEIKGAPKELGAFQHLPMVMCSKDILTSAMKKAKNVGPTRGITNMAKREKNKGAKQLDALTKELALPLRMYIEKFPQKHHLHAYEYALIDLTFGTGMYEEILDNVNNFRKRILDVGKNYASLCAKSLSKRDAEEILKEGFSKLEEHFQRNGTIVDELVSVAKTLRAMPVFNLKVPTLCLVGAPNVGKSSLVRVLSTGKPEVCNYPFTTRGISMGHIFVNGDVYQVTDTPGLLKRPDDERNNMEKLTLAALSHLPTAVLYVHDLTGECGVNVSDQFLLYKEMKEKFGERPWVDVVSKADLLSHTPLRLKDSLSSDSEEFYKSFGPHDSIHVSVQTGLGIEELKERVLSLLSRHFG